MLKKITLSALGALLFSLPAFAQIPNICPGSFPGASACADACVSCDLDGYTGTTAGYFDSPSPGFCDVVENNQWLAFTAGASEGTFMVVPANCLNGDGLQLALFDDCSATQALACSAGQSGGGSIPVSVTSTLLPGKTYFLMIDGYQGDQCEFTLNVSPANAAQAPAVGASGPIQGPGAICPGGSFTYSLGADVPGAGYYRWTAPPGSLINGQSGTVTVPAPGGKTVSVYSGYSTGTIRVTPLNACQPGTQVSRTLNISPIPPTIIPPITITADDLPFIWQDGYWVSSSGTYEAVFSNINGCDSIVRQQIIVLPASEASGRVFADVNGDGIYNFNDFPLNNIVVSASSGALATTIQPGGLYNFAQMPPGDTIRATVNLSGITVTPAFRINQIGPNPHFDFAVTGNGGDPDLNADLSNVHVFRPGFDTKVILRIRNRSLNVQTNTLAKLYLPDFLTIQSTVPAPSSIVGDTLFWNLGVVSPGDYISCTVVVTTDVGTALNTPVVLHSWVTPANDGDPSNNNRTIQTQVVGAFDPNDKQVNPAYLTPTLLANRHPLEYTIRFQNTGNFPAETVRVVDTLQSTLDPATFEFISSSHPCSWRMEGHGVVEFTFADINLPDSISNEPGSHGFVKFSLRPRANLAIGDWVENFCDIYFDFNPPVRTNTAQTRAVYFIPGVLPDYPGLDSRPNPAAYRSYFSWEPAAAQAGTLRLFDIWGIPVGETAIAAGSRSTDLFVGHLAPGVYVALLEIGNNRYSKTIVVYRGNGVVKSKG